MATTREELALDTEPPRLYMLLAREMEWPHDNPTLDTKKWVVFMLGSLRAVLKTEEGRAAFIAEFEDVT